LAKADQQMVLNQRRLLLNSHHKLIGSFKKSSPDFQDCFFYFCLSANSLIANTNLSRS
jgi:hypothetical protein